MSLNLGIVITLDQRASRGEPDQIDETAKRLNAEFKGALRRRFVRTAGDEMQAVTTSGNTLARITTACLEAGTWWVGVGLGPIETPLPRTARESRGPAFWSAREAVERAKNRHRSPQPVSVRGEPNEIALDLDAALTALAFIVNTRTKRQHEVSRLARRMSPSEVAARLKISPQAVSQLIHAAGLEEEERLVDLVERRVSHGE